jgi:hypothetical protein
VLGSRLDEVWERRLDRVVGPENINVYNRLHRIGRQLVDRGKKVARCARTLYALSAKETIQFNATQRNAARSLT